MFRVGATLSSPLSLPDGSVVDVSVKGCVMRRKIRMHIFVVRDQSNFKVSKQKKVVTWFM